MAFETFTEKPLSRRSGIPFVSINPKGGIGINGQAFQRLGTPPAITLAYDRDLNLVRIATAHPTDPGAFRTGRTERGQGQNVHARMFFDAIRFTLPSKTTRVEPYQWGNGWVVIDLCRVA